MTELPLDDSTGLPRFASVLAHELRNPLSGIKIALQALERHAQLTGRHATRLEIALREVGTMERVLAALMAWARPPPPSLGTLAAGALVDGALALVDRDLTEAGVHLVRDGRHDRLELSSDPSLATAAFAELLRNAAQASTAGAELRVEVVPGRDHHALQVRDAGSGLSQEALAHAFEPFFTTRARGLGLGLAIARGAARSMGGDVTLDRGEPGTIARLALAAAGSAGAAP